MRLTLPTTWLTSGHSSSPVAMSKTVISVSAVPRLWSTLMSVVPPTVMANLRTTMEGSMRVEVASAMMPAPGTTAKDWPVSDRPAPAV